MYLIMVKASYYYVMNLRSVVVVFVPLPRLNPPLLICLDFRAPLARLDRHIIIFLSFFPCFFRSLNPVSRSVFQDCLPPEPPTNNTHAHTNIIQSEPSEENQLGHRVAAARRNKPVYGRKKDLISRLKPTNHHHLRFRVYA